MKYDQLLAQNTQKLILKHESNIENIKANHLLELKKLKKEYDKKVQENKNQFLENSKNIELKCRDKIKELSEENEKAEETKKELKTVTSEYDKLVNLLSDIGKK
jgi:iron uptake system EfeUOB component EfeO/EfeM